MWLKIVGSRHCINLTYLIFYVSMSCCFLILKICFILSNSLKIKRVFCTLWFDPWSSPINMKTNDTILMFTVMICRNSSYFSLQHTHNTYIHACIHTLCVVCTRTCVLSKLFEYERVYQNYLFGHRVLLQFKLYGKLPWYIWLFIWTKSLNFFF